MLTFLTRRPRVLDDAAVALLRAVGAQVGEVVRARLAVAALRESEARYRALVDTAPDAVLVHAQGRVLYANAAAARLFGAAAPSAMHGRTVMEMVPAEEQEGLRARLARAAADQSATPIAARLARLDDGRVFDAEVSASPVRFAGVDGVGHDAIQAVLRDVSERRTMEEALRASESRFRSVFDSAAVGVSVIDDTGIVVQANAAFEAFLGYEPGELLGRFAPDLSPADDAEVTREPVAALRAGRCASVTVEKRFLHRDGTVRWASLTLSRMMLDEVRRAILGVTVDVTERRRAQEDLAREQAFLRATLDSLSDGVVACDADGRLTLFNRAAREFHGLPPEGELGADQWASRYSLYRADGVSPLPVGEIPLVRAFVGEVVRDAQMVIAPTEGPARMLRANGQAILGDNGATLGAVVAMRDETQRARAEAALRDSETRFRMALDGGRHAFAVLRPIAGADGTPEDFEYVEVNETFEAMCGRSAEEVVGMRFTALWPASRDDGVLEGYRRVMATGQPFEAERENHDPDVPTHWFSIQVLPLADGVATLARDISPQKEAMLRQQRAEAALRESEAQFRGVLETVRSVAVTLDTQGVVTFANEALCTLTGWTREETVGVDWFARFVPDGDVMRTVFRSVLAGDAVAAHYENELLTRSGERRVIAFDNTLLRDAAGTVIGTASIGHDVTEQRALEQRLAALSEHDELTGLLNRRGFRRFGDHAVKSAHRSARGDALLFLDLDRFKPINDTYGHAAGDDALRAVADMIRTTIRDADFCARLGGDEFVIYAVGLQPGEGGVLAERLRGDLRAHNAAAHAAGRPYDVEFTIGMAELVPGDSLDALLARGDAALYALKASRTR